MLECLHPVPGLVRYFLKFYIKIAELSKKKKGVQLEKSGNEIIICDPLKSGSTAKEQIMLSQITHILEGKTTNNLKKSSHEYGKCFAIVTNKDTFEFAAETAEVYLSFCNKYWDNFCF
ncbi:hypothetical protein RFI_04067 [Reticulomyxa filosa]|uniref:Uncharacterized protein n=1 Tax=Reticulomyxa filosa TaxID=46433 RepID=X6P4I8_RETFI|nr:hypothetical protein RFI_04067 [Reticulomyxa filosa]|eukprot:ETO33038.1 hypothetical protein RFI_04067 [Reticulomyxa filosa]